MRRLRLGLMVAVFVAATALLFGQSITLNCLNQNGVANCVAKSVSAALTITQSGSGDVLDLASSLFTWRVGTAGNVGASLFTGIDTPSCGVSSLSNVSTNETTLCTFNVPTGLLNTNGQKVRVVAWLSGAANVNSKTVRLYFGATLVSSSVSTSTSEKWLLEEFVVRTGAATQTAVGRFTSGGAAVASLASPAESLSGVVVIKVSGQSAVGGGDVTLGAMFVELVP